jgi:hypothetical protein
MSYTDDFYDSGFVDEHCPCCGARMYGSDHCPCCGCEEYESYCGRTCPAPDAPLAEHYSGHTGVYADA